MYYRYFVSISYEMAVVRFQYHFSKNLLEIPLIHKKVL